MKLSTRLVVPFVLALVGCQKENPPPPPAPAPVAAPAPAPTPAPSAAPSASSAGTEGKMLHCPSAVAGTNTAIKDVPGGVELTVSARDATDDATTKEVRARAAFLVDAAKSTPATEHNGSGEVGGKFGRCPVVMRGTNVVAKDAAGGSVITVTTRDAKEQDWLRRESRSRVDELSAPAADESMHVKEVHCPSAVAGAKVAIADAPDGVTVAVTSTDPASAKEIRDRAHALLAASQLGSEGRAGGGGGGGKHPGGAGGNGNGGGGGDGTGGGRGQGNGAGGGRNDNGQGQGGGFGKCPLVVRGATLDVSDVAGGVSVHLKAKDGTQVADVRAAVRARATDAGLAR